MAGTGPAHASPEPALQSPLDRHHFLLRRLHSLTGIVPVGVFLIFHLFTNFQLVVGDFQHEVEFIHNMPALLFIEITLWASIAFHAGLGIVYTFVGAKPNVERYDYGANWRYFLQRVTGIMALIFIFLHIATLRWQWNLFGWHTPFMVNAIVSDHPVAAATTALALQAHWLVVLLYVVGGLAVVYHWSNGLWTAAITWGMTISREAQVRWGYVCAIMGAVLTIFLLGAIYGAMTLEVTQTDVELIQLQLRYDAGQITLEQLIERAEAVRASE